MLTELMKQGALWGIDHGGYLGAATLMALESMIAPVPSELVMPPLGMRLHPDAVTGVVRFTWQGAIIATSIGSLVGSLISYWLGYIGGKPLVMRVGKYLLVNEDHLDLTTRWFGRWGSATVFVCRFVPVVRHLISIPAGVARMNLWRFCLYTLIGATMWNTLLLWLGFYIGKKETWDTILKYRSLVDACMVVGLVMMVAGWFWLHWKKKPAMTEIGVKA